MATYIHTGSTSWVDVMPQIKSDLSREGGVELVALAANTGLCYYSDQASPPTTVAQGFPVRLDNPMGVFIPYSRLQTTGKLWVNITVSGDNLGVRSY